MAVASLVFLTYGANAADRNPGIDRGDGDGGIQLRQGQDDDGNFRRTPTYARANYVWPYATGPYYGTVGSSEFRAAGVLHTQVGSFKLDSELALPAELRSRNKLDAGGMQYFIIQAHPEQASALREVKTTIENLGGAVVGDMPVAAVVARMDAATLATIDGTSGVMAIEPYHPALKLNPMIGRTPLADPAKALSEVYELEIRLHAGENAEAVASALAGLGGKVNHVWPDTVRVEIHRNQLPAVAEIEAVASVFEHVPARPHAEETTTTMQTGQWNQGATPYHDAGVDGGGDGGLVPAQILYILDSGISVDAGDLSDTKTDAGSTTGSPTHRKLRLYASTGAFGGTGDLLGCDASQQGGFTHGHVVAATAVGNATNVDTLAYGGNGFVAQEPNNGPVWALDGVAPRALLIAYDGQQTPQSVSCSDPLQDTISPGDLYSGGTSGSLGNAYNQGARIYNFSWGANSNVYSTNAVDTDQFIFDKGNAMVFISAGNAGQDADSDNVPDLGSLGTPATAKNALAIGASRNANDPGSGPEFRAVFSSTGPAVNATVNRVAPQLMAPGDELGGGSLGFASEFACKSSDNDQNNPVECDIVTGVEGTSFASPAAAGAGVLVRDYFAQGFYPSGAATLADQVPDVSGALVKAMLIASADFMSGDGTFNSPSIATRYRWNNEQGYGRIQLDNVLPLETWPPSASGLAVADGGIVGGAIDLSLAGSIDATVATTQSATFEVCDDTQELRVALAWVEAPQQALVNDLNLRITSPDPDGGGPLSPVSYVGNYFTDDANKDGTFDPGTEDCPGLDGTTGILDEEQWSIPQCVNTPFDTQNPTEAIFLTADINGDNGGVSPDPDPSDDTQIIPGTWTVEITTDGSGTSNNQRYALAISGGVCLGSSVRFDQGTYTCNAASKISVNELAEGGDLNPTESDVSNRTTVDVLDSNGMVVDTEDGIVFTKPNPNALRFESDDVLLSNQTARQSGNNVLDVQTGDQLRVTYADTTATRRSFASVNCVLNIGPGDITFAQFGEDDNVLILGGCERNARGLFEFGFPDRYMDAGEQLQYRFAFNSAENFDLDNVIANLRCVHIDADSPVECQPTSDDCADPRRENNDTCDGSSDEGHAAGTQYMAILETPKRIGFLPAGSAVAESFGIKMNPTITGTPQVEMILEVTASSSGKSAKGVAVNQHTLDVDEESTYYSTDFPFGGTAVVVVDRNNNEIAQGTYPPPTGGQLSGTPTTNIGDFLEDYRFETKSYGDLTATGRNLGIQAPWHFDNGPGGFTSGIAAVTDEATISNIIAQWGEDKNFNGIEDGVCRFDSSISCFPPSDVTCQIATGFPDCSSVEDRDTSNGQLDRNWSTRGGCGWQTRAPNSCSLDATRGCHINSDCLGRCRDAADSDLSSNIACSSDTPCTPNGETCIGFSGTCTGAAGAAQQRGGVWHTGRIDLPTLAQCMVNGSASGQCQRFEVIGGNTGQRSWLELLVTPELEKVNGDDYTVEIVDFAWNQSIDLPDNNVAYTWEFDTDTEQLEPVDLKSDFTLLNLGFGEYGAVTATGNPDLSDGFSVFAPMAVCSGSGDPCKDTEQSADCPTGQTCTFTGASTNGNAGRNRVGDNACFFEGTAVPTAGQGQLGLAGPPDDDLNQDGDGSIDEFVEINGPHRNMDIYDWNGPDMRFATLEDIYGPTGNRFQGSIGILNLESTDTSTNPTTPGYGLAVDDVVVEWREFQLVEDNVDCAVGGSCAAMDVDQVNVYEGRSALLITVQDPTPYGPGAVNVNDCNDNGVFTDPGDDQDCDDNGTDDIIVNVTSTAELAADGLGELVALNRVDPGSDIYKGEIPVSVALDSPGVLFIQVSGADNPTVTVTYDDHEDGTGNICRNDVDPASQGEVQVATTFFVPTGSVSVVNAVLSDDNDNDGFADSNETVDMQITVRNTTRSTDMRGLVARLSTNDPKIDCILNAFVNIGDLDAGEQTLTTEAFQFKVADVDRTTVNENFAATFAVTVSSDEFDAVVIPQSVTIDLDLDASGGSGPTTFVEDFEGGTLGAFTNQNLDQGLFTFPASDGYRCQYSDPDWVFSNSYGAIDDCIVGASSAQLDAVFWSNEDSRGYTGSRSMYYGVELSPALGFTTPLAILDAVRLNNPVNLTAAAGVVSELSFKHQTSILDSDTVNATPGQSADRIAMNLQVADSDGNGVGDWIKLEPYLNTYDQQAEDNYFNCTFDPIDDGNTEDTFFDPSDPQRRLGPSTTCFPGFSFVFQGATSGPFSPANIGKATEGPGLQGATGEGTWIESRVDLSRFRGRRVRVRWVGTALKVATFETWESIFVFNPDPGDDGMWIDDVQISNTLTTPATLSVDNAVFAGTPCGNTCNTVNAVLAVDPAAITAPGQAIELDAVASTADKSLNGTLQFRYGIDVDASGDLDEGDVVLRSWSDNPTLVESPFSSTDYVVEVRCSTDPSCSASTGVTVAVACPGDIGDLLCGKTATANTCTYTPGKNNDTEVDFAKVSFTSGSNINYAAPLATGSVPAGDPISHSGDSPTVGTVIGYLVKLDGTPSDDFCNSPDWGNESPQCDGCPSRNSNLGDP